MFTEHLDQQEAQYSSLVQEEAGTTIGKHRYWMADNVLYDIVPMGKKGVQYIVIKIVK